jgi:hypothetical protein
MPCRGPLVIEDLELDGPTLDQINEGFDRLSNGEAVRQLVRFDRAKYSVNRDLSGALLPLPVRRERVGARVLVRLCASIVGATEPSPWPSPGVPGEGTMLARARQCTADCELI